MNFNFTKNEHPSLIANKKDISDAKEWIKSFNWYRSIIESHKKEVDQFISHGPIYISPIKQIYQYKMYQCPKHDVDLIYDEYSPFEHRCPTDQTELFLGEKYDSAWSGWYNKRVADYLYWMGILYQIYDDDKYAKAGKEILMRFADLYLSYPTENTILGPAHIFFGTLSESFWGVYMAYGYDLIYNYSGFLNEDHEYLKRKLFYPLAKITQQFPESASNRQLWYNNVSAAVGFLYNDKDLFSFAFHGKYGFEWQLGSALPESGFWSEGPGYHFVTLRGMIHLAEMAKNHGLDLYQIKINGRTIKSLFDAPFEMVLPNYEFPRIKDSGGGNILEYATFYEVGYAIYKDPKYLYLINKSNLKRGFQVVGIDSGLGVQEEPVSMFRLIPDLPNTIDEIYPSKSTNMVGNGLALLRNGDGKDKRCVHLDYGILGGEHGHPDRLQIGYYATGKNWIVDSLNESYFNPNLQTWFRQTISHNTIVIDQTTQAWANGYENFFGDSELLQVASGGSDAIYPGATINRTVLQVGDYFFDIIDITCKDKRVIDIPYHSFGEVEVFNVNLKKKENNLFGEKPGIPGYDQLTEIYSDITDKSWQAVFNTHDNKYLLIKGIAEKGTEVFKAINPPIGGFYKQMVTDQSPLPMIMLRRNTDKTRFIQFLHAYEGFSNFKNFEYKKNYNTFIVHKPESDDIIYFDIRKSVFWLLQKDGNNIISLSGFNVKGLKYKNITFLMSSTVLEKIECKWNKSKLLISLHGDFVELRFYAPNIKSIELNGKEISFTRKGKYVKISQTDKVIIELLKSDNLFIGSKNILTLQVWNNSFQNIDSRIEVFPANKLKQSIKGQLGWWGGVVNLLPLHKGKVEKRVFPKKYNLDLSWTKKISSSKQIIKPGQNKRVDLPVIIPNDAPPAKYGFTFCVGDAKLEKSFILKEPISAKMMIPNNQKGVLKIDLKNNSDRPQKVSLLVDGGDSWKIPKNKFNSIQMSPNSKKELKIPLQLKRYNSYDQLNPINLKVKAGNFTKIIQRDFYIGLAKFTRNPPSLSGDWVGWDKSAPMKINRVEQICRLLMGNQKWKGPKDLSAKIFAIYDDEFLYIGAEVTDTVVITHFDFPKMSYPYDVDSMEIILDTRTGADQGSDPPTPGIFRQICLPEYRKIDFNPETWQGGSAGGPVLPKPNLISDAETFFNLTKKGYNMICKIPFKNLNGFKPKTGYKIGFDVAINDNDGTTYRKNQHIWAGYTQNQSWWDMSSIGSLIFE